MTGAGGDADGPDVGGPDKGGPDTEPGADEPVVSFEGARRPERRRDVDAGGARISVVEWGDVDAPALAIAHGGFDFAETLDVFAPLLADAGWRVVSWDQRGHGDSEWTQLYSWEADLRDAAAVIATLPPEPLPFLGHSKGGSLMMHLTNTAPHRVSHLVNLDGLPSDGTMSDVSEHERTRRLRDEMDGWLAHRRTLTDKQRRPGTIDELAERRGRMNPRLSFDWLRYLVSVGANHDPDGWRWKLDPTMRMGGFGPWRPEWSMLRLPGIGVPVMGILGLELEVMGWGTRPEHVLPFLPPGARFEALDGVGHFVHIEQPEMVAGLVLDFLGDAPTTGGRS